MFFAYSLENVLQSVSWNGDDLRTVRVRLPKPYDVTFLNGEVYWIDYNFRSVFKVGLLQCNLCVLCLCRHLLVMEVHLQRP